MLNASEICHRCYDGLESVVCAALTSFECEKDTQRECSCVCALVNLLLCVYFRSRPSPHQSSCRCVSVCVCVCETLCMFDFGGGRTGEEMNYSDTALHLFSYYKSSVIHRRLKIILSSAWERCFIFMY